MTIHLHLWLASALLAAALSATSAAELPAGKGPAPNGEIAFPELTLRNGSVRFGPDGKTLFLLEARSEQQPPAVVRSVDIADGRTRWLMKIEADEAVTRIEPFPDGKRLLVVWYSWTAALEQIGDADPYLNVQMVDLATGGRTDVTRLSQGSDCLALSPDGKTLVHEKKDVPGDDGSWYQVAVKFRDPATGMERPSLKRKPRAGLIDMCFSADGGTLLLSEHLSDFNRAVNDGVLEDFISVWDMKTLALRCTLKAKMTTKDRFESLAVSPDGRRMAAVLNDSGGSDKPSSGCHVIVWDVETGKEKRLRSGPVRDDYLFVAFSPNGRLLAVTDKDGVAFFDPADGRKLAELTGKKRVMPVDEGDPVSRPELRFSPDGRLLAWLQHDGSLRVMTLERALKEGRAEEHKP